MLLYQHEVDYILRTFSGQKIRKRDLLGEQAIGAYNMENALARPEGDPPYGTDFDLLVVGHTLAPTDDVDYMFGPHKSSDDRSIRMWKFDQS